MDNKYIVYEVYGKDKPSKYLQGITQKIILGKTREYDNIKSVWNAIDNDSLNLRTNTIMNSFNFIMIPINYHNSICSKI